jgi:hypothetical protein
MPEQTGRFEWLKVMTTVFLAVVLSLLTVGLVYSVYEFFNSMAYTEAKDWPAVLPSLALVLAVLAGMVWAVMVFGVLRIVLSAHTHVENMAGEIGRLETLLEDQASSARKLVDLASLSDQTKSLLYRDREVEAFREMMHSMLVRQDYKMAEELIAGIEKRPSMALDAAVMRQELEATRQASIEGKIDLAIGRVEEIIAKSDWPRAVREAARMTAAFPHNAKILALPQHIEEARMKHKRDLLQNYGEAVRKNDVDASIELLKELDRYLSPQEAAALQDSARGVFKAHLHNLGVQFAIRVAEKQWKEAITAGEEIMREFPNSRMAHEVRAKMDLLNERAGVVPGDAKA